MEKIDYEIAMGMPPWAYSQRKNGLRPCFIFSGFCLKLLCCKIDKLARFRIERKPN